MSRRAGLLLGCVVLALFGRAEAAAPVCEAEESNFDSPGETIPTQGGTGLNGAFVPGDVAVQYVWSPYGECLASEVFDDAAPLNPVGHQGLFFIRLNGKITDKPHEPYHGGVYYNRNRMYEPSSGRFLERDMNATGMPVLADAAYHGFPIVPMSDPYDAMGSYGDGMNLFGYLGGNPLSRGDALGLVYDPFEDTDDFIGMMWAERANTAEMIHERYTALMAATGRLIAEGMFVTLVPGGAAMLAVYHMSHAAADMQQNGLDFENGLDFGLNAVGLGTFNRVFRSMTRHRSELRGARTAGRFAGCNSFVEGTLVTTPGGELPIELLREGDWIIARHEEDPQGREVVRRVSGVMSSEALCIVRLFFSNGESLSITEGHEVWTVERDWIAAHDLREGETIQTRDGSATVVYIFASESPQTVYNLEVAGAFTYYAEGVWVHNCLEVLVKLPNSRLVRRPAQRGNAPFGDDGKSVEIHHIGQNPSGPYAEMTRFDHRGRGNHGVNHPIRPSNVDHGPAWREAVKEYWEKQWDSGRFDLLPN